MRIITKTLSLFGIIAFSATGLGLTILATSCGKESYVWKTYNELKAGDSVKSVNFANSVLSGEYFNYTTDEDVSDIIFNRNEVRIHEHVFMVLFDLDIGNIDGDEFDIFALEMDPGYETAPWIADDSKILDFSWDNNSVSVNFDNAYSIVSIEKTANFIGILDYAQYQVLK